MFGLVVANLLLLTSVHAVEHTADATDFLKEEPSMMDSISNSISQLMIN